MPINSFPIATVPPAANLIINTPAGAVTATDVQAAINQLASLIPSIGPGTDPLFLVNGLSVNTINPTVSGDPNDRWAARIIVNTDNSANNPNFSNNEVLELQMSAINGDATNGGGTIAKTTFLPLNIFATYNASGQKFLTNENLLSYGMSDSAIGQQFVQYSGGPVNGDEGQGFRLVSTLKQQEYLNTTTIQSKPTQSVVNTTTTQTITASKDAQTVTVVSTAGAVVGDWVVIQQQVAQGAPNLEAVKIISFTPTSITGIFRRNHPNGTTVTPALVIQCFSTFQMGQDRVLVNLDPSNAYSVGSVTAISGGGMDFTGTALNSPNGPVGGTALNIGAISLTADDCTTSPFSVPSPLKSWYQITQVTSATHLAIWSFSVAGDTSYHGRGPGPAGSGAGGTGAYIIRPCARVLRLDGTGGTVNGFLICETSNPALWQVGHAVEQAVCPYPDVTGFQYFVSNYTPGGAGVRAFMDIRNMGARMFGYGILLRGGTGSSGIGNPTGDAVGYDTGLAVSSCNTGLIIANCKDAALFISTDNGNWSGRIAWDHLGSPFIDQSYANGGLVINPSLGGALGSDPLVNGYLQFISPGAILNPGTAQLFEMSWAGWLHLANVTTSGERPFINIDFVTSLTNYERLFLGWRTGEAVIGTEAAVATARALTLKCGSDQLRFDDTLPVQFKAAPNFSANAAVATVLGSVGPAGASTTVQKWLTIRDDGGVTRYIPCF